MRISEIYRSTQGEGRLTGVESIFVRTSGCNLRCDFCDTPFTSWQPEGDDQSIDEILSQIAAHTCDHVVLTGGEPMLQSELIPLTLALRALGKHITIETAGTLYLPVDCDLMSISPKLANSTPSVERDARWHVRHEQSRHVPGVIRALIAQYAYQLKFVVDTLADCDEVERYLAELPEIARENVMLMPQGIDEPTLQHTFEWLQPYCDQHELQFCPRKQIEWFGFTRRT